MDDLVGTQVPTRRLTDPAEALQALERAIPGLVQHRRAVPLPIDWTLVEQALGCMPPGDYRLLAELYPTLHVGDYLGIWLPKPGSEHLMCWDEEDLDILQEWCEDSGLPGLYTYPEPGGLLPWAASNQGDYFLWTTADPNSDNWTVTVASRSFAWWHYEGGMVQFLAELVDGTLEPWALPPVTPEVEAS